MIESQIFIGMGSNVGDREHHLRHALTAMRETPGISTIRQSSLYKTQPWGWTDQPWFLNAAVQVESSLTPKELLMTLKAIEANLGRRETFRWGPREIDLDLLLFGDLRIAEPELTIPHPGLTVRAFVLAPLLEIAPEARDPATGRRLQDFWDALPENEREGILLWKPPLS